MSTKLSNEEKQLCKEQRNLAKANKASEQLAKQNGLDFQSANIENLSNYCVSKTANVKLNEYESTASVTDIKNSSKNYINEKYTFSWFIKEFNKDLLNPQSKGYMKYRRLLQAYNIKPENFKLSFGFFKATAIRNSDGMFCKWANVSDKVIKSDNDNDNRPHKVLDKESGEYIDTIQTKVPIKFSANLQSYLNFLCSCLNVYKNSKKTFDADKKKAIDEKKKADNAANKAEKLSNQLAKIESLSVEQIEKLLAEKKANEQKVA